MIEAFRMPRRLLGAIPVPATGLFAWLRSPRRIGIELQLGDWQTIDERSTRCSVFTQMFVDPPTLSLFHDGELTLNLNDGVVRYRSESSRLDFDGKFKPESASVVAVINLRAFQLM